MADLITDYLASDGIQCEGRERGMYRDTAGLVTVGIGCMLANATSAACLPFARLGGTRATAAEITAEYSRIQLLPAGRLPRAYAPTLFLTDDAVDALARNKVQGFVAGLQHVFRGFDGFPRPAQLALLDMAFNLGIGRPPLGPQRGTGLQAFTRMCISVGLRNWTAAAQQCDRDRLDPAFAKRNAWTRAQFLAAAHAA